MKRLVILGVVLSLAVMSSGCACYGPCGGMYGGRVYEGSCNETIAPYSCGPSACGGMGVDYVDGGPGAGLANCGGYNSCGVMGGGCGMMGGCYGGCGMMGGCGHNCLSFVGDSIRFVGDGALTIISVPFVCVGNFFACFGNCLGNSFGHGCYSSYNGCGCSNEVYYGDNCYQPHDFCDPCGGDACGGGCGVSSCGIGGGVVSSGCGTGYIANSYVGNNYYGPVGTPAGCTRCSGGFTDGIQPGDSTPTVLESGHVKPVPTINQNARVNKNRYAGINRSMNQNMNMNYNTNRTVQQVSHVAPNQQPAKNSGVRFSAQKPQPLQPPQTKVAGSGNDFVQ